MCRLERTELLRMPGRPLISSPIRTGPRPWLVYIFVPLFGLLASFSAYFATQQWERMELQHAVSTAADHYVSDLQEQVQNYLSGLVALRILYNHSDNMTEDDFMGAARELSASFPGAMAYEWIPRTPGGSRAALEASVRKKYPGFMLTERSPDGGVHPAKDKEEHLPILFVYPLEVNKKAHGLDLSTSLTKPNLDLAAATGLPTGTKPIPLVQQDGKASGLIMILPVYTVETAPSDLKERKEKLTGYFQCVLSIPELFRSAWIGHTDQTLDIYVFDTDSPLDPPVFVSAFDGQSHAISLVPAESPGAFLATASVARNFKFFQRQWGLAFRPTAGFLDTGVSWQPPVFFLLGLLVTFLAFAYLRRIMEEEKRIQALVERRTKELREANDKLVAEIQIRQEAEEARNRLEHHLQQTQKMEAVGTLAGGIAHDFNNILTAILGNLDLVRSEIPDIHPAQESLTEIDRASHRAKDLIRQILTFSCQQPQVEFKTVEIGPLIEETLKLLRATIPSAIELKSSVAPGCPPFSADSVRIHQILLNLCTNAWHAMEDRHGLIEIHAEGMKGSEARRRFAADILSEKCLHLSIRDTGHGMDEETQKRIFEPFFTTKEQGRGTGLGLSTVHGIIKAHRGAIQVESTPGEGTTFHLFFPAVSAPAEARKTSTTLSRNGNGERIMFVDDEEALTILARRQLTRLGYQCETFTHPDDALAAFREKPGTYDLLMTDLTMPELSGLELARAIWKIRPGLPVILNSGYMNDPDCATAQDEGVREILLKPAEPAEVAAALARALKKKTD
jgi:signal transduction histidine kinase/ActR/RegA family two-component response regulator